MGQRRRRAEALPLGGQQFKRPPSGRIISKNLAADGASHRAA